MMQLHRDKIKILLSSVQFGSPQSFSFPLEEVSTCVIIMDFISCPPPVLIVESGFSSLTPNQGRHYAQKFRFPKSSQNILCQDRYPSNLNVASDFRVFQIYSWSSQHNFRKYNISTIYLWK